MLEMKMNVGENKNDNRKEGGIIKSKQRLPQKRQETRKTLYFTFFCRNCPPKVSMIFWILDSFNVNLLIYYLARFIVLEDACNPEAQVF